MAGAARIAGFKSVTVIDDDLGWSGSGTVERPGFERLVAMVGSGDIGAVYCIEVSGLARNGRDWQAFLWLRAEEIKMPVVRRNVGVTKIVWKSPVYDAVMQILHNPLYARAYAFARTAQQTQIVDGRAHKVNGVRKPERE